MLSRLQDQASGYQAEAQRGSDMIQNFDLEKQLYSGAESAYRLGHEQLNTLIGGEVLQGIHQGIGPLYRTGKALAQRAKGMPTTLEEARAQAQARLPSADAGGPPPVQRTALPDEGTEMQSVVRQSLDQAPPTRDERNLRYNPQKQRMETEGGAEAKIGGERDIRTRTAPEQQEFDTPSFSGRNIPRGGRGPQERTEYPDFGSKKFQAPTQAEHEARMTAEREEALPHTARRTAEPELPDLEGIGSGERIPIPAEPAVPASIGTQPVAGEVQSLGEQSTYTRSAYRVNPKVTKAAEPEVEPDIGEPLDFEPRRMGVTGADVTDVSRSSIYSGTERLGKRPNLGVREPAAAEPKTQLTQRVTTTQELREPTPAVPADPDVDLQNRLDYLRRGNLDDQFPDVPSQPDITARQGQVQQTSLQDAAKQETDEYGLPKLDTTATPGPARVAPGDPDGEGEKDVDKDAEIRDDNSGLLEGEIPELQDIATKPKTSGGDDEDEDIGKDIGEDESKVVGDEELADAIPGVGEIIGGIIAAGAAIYGVAEGVSASKDKPPQQPGGTPSMSTAFDSAPVIDSSDFHQL